MVVKIKKPKAQKTVLCKDKIEECKQCLEADQLKKQNKPSEKSNLNTDNLRINHKEFLKNIKLKLKT